jgi:hypothetical protein
MSKALLMEELMEKEDLLAMQYMCLRMDAVKEHLTLFMEELLSEELMLVENVALGTGNSVDVDDAEGIRHFCLAGEGVEHDMDVIRVVDDSLNAMALSLLVCFHGDQLQREQVRRETGELRRKMG